MICLARETEEAAEAASKRHRDIMARNSLKVTGLCLVVTEAFGEIGYSGASRKQLNGSNCVTSHWALKAARMNSIRGNTRTAVLFGDSGGGAFDLPPETGDCRRRRVGVLPRP